MTDQLANEAAPTSYTPEELWKAGWGIPPEARVNRPVVRLLLSLSREKRLPHRYLNRARFLLHRAVSLVVSADFRSKSFGEGLYLPHPYGIVVHSATVIGDRVTVNFENAGKQLIRADVIALVVVAPPRPAS